MNKIKTLAMGSLIAVAGINNAFADEVIPEEFLQVKATRNLSDEEFAKMWANLKANPKLYCSAYSISPCLMPGMRVKLKDDGLNKYRDFSFDEAYPIYKKHLDDNNEDYVVGFVQIQKLEESATTPEQQELFKAFKTQYDTFMNKALERDNDDFAAVTKKLLEKASDEYTNDSARWHYIKEGTIRFNDHFNGNRKSKATKAQLKEMYTSYRTFTRNYPNIMYERFNFTPDGKKVTDILTYESDDYEIIRKDLRDKFGRDAGKLGRVYQDGTVYRITESGEKVFVCQIARDGSIWDVNHKEIGRIDYNGKIYINGKVKAEERSVNFGYEYYIGKKFVGSIRGNEFSYANKAMIPFYYSTQSKLRDAFALFLYKIIPQK